MLVQQQQQQQQQRQQQQQQRRQQQQPQQFRQGWQQLPSTGMEEQIKQQKTCKFQTGVSFNSPVGAGCWASAPKAQGAMSTCMTCSICCCSQDGVLHTPAAAAYSNGVIYLCSEAAVGLLAAPVQP
jgi:hypothetical protein